MEETKSEELRVEALSRALKYEEKAKQSEKIIVKECLKEMDRRGTRVEQSRWEKKRREELGKMNVSEESRRKREKERNDIKTKDKKRKSRLNIFR